VDNIEQLKQFCQEYEDVYMNKVDQQQVLFLQYIYIFDNLVFI
jgi:hypothetical protein